MGEPGWGEDAIEIAREKHIPRTTFIYGDAEDLSPLENASFDTMTAVLSLQNIKNVDAVMKSAARILSKKGRIYAVLNHPCFRVPQSSSWDWTEKKDVQYRRIDKYLSEKTIEIDMHPGERQKQTTLSFHRPLQWYSKICSKHGFAITKMEEWISHREGPKGKTFQALETSRKEIPLFLAMELIKID